MIPSRALKDFTSFSDDALQNKSLTVYAGLSGNTYFPNPSPTIQELDAAIQEYSSALAQSKNRDMAKVEEKKALRIKLTGILTSLVHYVNFAANGNRLMLLTTGLTVSAETITQVVFSGVINNLKVVQGDVNGTLLVNFKPVAGKRVYIYCYKESSVENDYWKIETSKVPTFTILGLERGKEYQVRVGVVDPSGKTIYAAVITTMVV